MAVSKGTLAARKLMEDCGIEDPLEIPLSQIIAGRGATLIEEPLGNADGRIVHGKKRSLIKVNSDIKYEGRKRFATAHELGHFEMHRDYPIHDDSKSLDWFSETLRKLKNGKQELEANEFATELLMPEKLFIYEAKSKPFSPDLLRWLAERFKTSITSVAFRYQELNLHPICLFFTSDNIVKYWKKSNDFYVWVPELTKLPPPSDSVATEYIESDYKQIYSRNESVQEIDKST